MILHLFYGFAAADDEPVASRLKTSARRLHGKPILKKWRLNVKEIVRLYFTGRRL